MNLINNELNAFLLTVKSVSGIFQYEKETQWFTDGIDPRQNAH